MISCKRCKENKPEEDYICSHCGALDWRCIWKKARLLIILLPIAVIPLPLARILYENDIDIGDLATALGLASFIAAVGFVAVFVRIIIDPIKEKNAFNARRKKISDIPAAPVTFETVALRNEPVPIIDNSQFAILDDAYLVRQDDELERKVRESLDHIASSGEEGIALLLARLQKDMGLMGNQLRVFFGGDLAWNEWLKKREIVRALARAHAVSSIPYLLELCGAVSSEQQFHTILQPACASALGEIGDARIVGKLKILLHGNEAGNETKRAIGEALEKLEGKPVPDPALIVAKADKMSKRDQGDEVLQTLAQLDNGLFDSLNNMQKYYVWYMRGMVYKFKGDKPAAIQCFETSLEYFDGPTAVSHMELRELR